MKIYKYNAMIFKEFLRIIILTVLSTFGTYGHEQLKALDLIGKGTLFTDLRSKQELDKEPLQNAFNIQYENIPQLIKLMLEKK